MSSFRIKVDCEQQHEQYVLIAGVSRELTQLICGLLSAGLCNQCSTKITAEIVEEIQATTFRVVDHGEETPPNKENNEGRAQ